MPETTTNEPVTTAEPAANPQSASSSAARE